MAQHTCTGTHVQATHMCACTCALLLLLTHHQPPVCLGGAQLGETELQGLVLDERFNGILRRKVAKELGCDTAGRGSPCCRSCEALGRPLGQPAVRLLGRPTQSPGRVPALRPRLFARGRGAHPRTACRSTTSQESISQQYNSSHTAVTQGYSASHRGTLCDNSATALRSGPTATIGY